MEGSTMTDLQLKIRRLAHVVSAGKKANKDVATLQAELEQLRAQRKAERAGEKKEKAGKKAEAAAPAEAPANA